MTDIFRDTFMSYGLYIHLPFCKRKCPYCAFTSIIADNVMIKRYCEAAASELKNNSLPPFTNTPDTLYIGGGTPSIVSADFIKTIVDQIPLSGTTEFTVEANPESLDSHWLERMVALGMTRISIGVQSLSDRVLKKLGRIHLSKQAVAAVKLSQSSGITSVSIDLMFGVPGQTFDDWRETLTAAIDLNPDHISAYSLGIEDDTDFFRVAVEGTLDVPDDETTADMYEMLAEILLATGYLRYEISNFAKPGHECRHNIGYWNFKPYLGIGASAHSFNGYKRSWNTEDTIRYCESIESNGNAESGSEFHDTRTHAIETIMLSLRTSDGLDSGRICGIRDNLLRDIEMKLTHFRAAGLTAVNSYGRVILTNKGSVLADEIIAELVSVI